MGYIVEVRCNTCTYTEQYRLGQGRTDGKLSQVLHYFSKEDQEKIQLLDQQEEVLTIAFHQELGLCRQCNTLQTIPVLKLYMKTDMIHVITGNCVQCTSDLLAVLVNDRTLELHCTKCHSGTLEIKETGLWD